MKARIAYTNAQIHKDEHFWSSVLRSDAAKTELYGDREAAFMWQKTNKAYKPKYIVCNIKHRGQKPGNLVKVEGIMKK